MSSRFDSALWQSRQLLLINKVKFVAVGLLQVILREFQRKLAQLRCHFTVSSLILFVQISSAANKSVVSILQQLTLFGSQVQLIFLSVHLLNAGEQFLVQTYVIAMLRQ